MTTFLLVRHAVHATVDMILVGRMAGVGLCEEGYAQATRLADRLANTPVAAIQSSPRRRAHETAEAIAARADLPVEIAPELDEIDVGEWTGRSFDELRPDPDWIRWNTDRAHARPPGGESMQELQRRVIGLFNRLDLKHPDDAIVMVTHAEVIRAALLHYLGLSLDAFAAIEVRPASVSTLQVSGRNGIVLAVNEA